MKRSFKPIHFLFLAFTLVLIWLQPVAASTLMDSRIRQIEFQLRSIQNQIQGPASRPGISSPPRRQGSPAIPGDPTFAEQFDNLAILAIELKQRVTALEEQVAQLSQQAA